MAFISRGKTNWKFIWIIIVLAFILASVAVYFTYKFRVGIKNQTSLESLGVAAGESCSYYGTLNQNFYLNEYTVQPGDSIYSIAANELGDASRMTELINLNQQWYPHLSVENPFIEVGWEIRLPAPSLPKSSGYLIGYGGKITGQENSYMGPYYILQQTADIPKEWQGANEQYGIILYLDPGTKYFGKTGFEVGDCVYVVANSEANGEHILAISPQDKNYFK